MASLLGVRWWHDGDSRLVCDCGRKSPPFYEKENRILLGERRAILIVAISVQVHPGADRQRSGCAAFSHFPAFKMKSAYHDCAAMGGQRISPLIFPPFNPFLASYGCEFILANPGSITSSQYIQFDVCSSRDQRRRCNFLGPSHKRLYTIIWLRVHLPTQWTQLSSFRPGLWSRHRHSSQVCAFRCNFMVGASATRCWRRCSHCPEYSASNVSASVDGRCNLYEGHLHNTDDVLPLVSQCYSHVSCLMANLNSQRLL